MRRVIALFIWGASALLGLCLGASGCADACADLQVICNDCSDPNHRAACEASVDDGAQDICEQNIDSYGNVCQ